MPVSKVRKRRTRTRARVPAAAPGLPVFPSILFPADITAPLTAPGTDTLRLDLLIPKGPEGLDEPAPRTQRRLPVTLTRRSKEQATIHWWGLADDESLRVHLSGTPDGQWSMQLSVHEAPPLAEDLLLLVDTFLAMAAAGYVGWALPGGQPLATGRLDERPPGLPVNYRNYLQALVDLGQFVGQPLAVPEHAQPDVARDVLTAGALLRGKTVRDQFEQATLRVTADDLDELRDTPLGRGPVRIRYKQTWSVQLPDQTIDIPIHVLYPSVVVSDWPSRSTDAVVDLVLEPFHDSTALLTRADDDEFLLELEPLPHLVDQAPDVPALVEPVPPATSHTRAWAALLDGAVVREADSPSALLDGLRDTGQPYDLIVQLGAELWEQTPSNL